MWRSFLIADNPSDVAWTQVYAIANKRRPQGPRRFFNSLQMTNSVGVGPGTLANVAVVTQNFSRSLLVIQNASTATAPDYAPTFYVGFGQVPKVGEPIALPPGVGIVFDVRVPNDAIYIGFGPYSNTDGSVVIQGGVKEGTITLPDYDTANISEAGTLLEILRLLRKAMGEPQVQPSDLESDIAGGTLFSVWG
jgi:hypothetical protein